MYINQNSLQYKHYVDFEKYAKFICEKFDISVQLESTRAETDGRTIYLPNVLSMTEKELDMMYAILLHEAGHIRYSTFSEEYFKSLKTKAHAFLANSIEDARIENLLMLDFGGAEEIFETLYCKYTQDKTLMKKVFKHDGSKPDLFATLAFHVHNVMVNCQTSTLKEISGARMANRVTRFWIDQDIDTLIAQNPMKGDADVIALTNEIYDRFITHFKIKDKTEKLDYAGELKEKASIEKKLSDLRKEAEKVEAQVAEIRSKMSEIADKVNHFDKEHAAEISQHTEKLDELQSEFAEKKQKVDWKNNFDKQQKIVNELPSKIQSLKEELDKQSKEKARLTEMLEKGVNGRGKEMTEEQKASTKEKIEVKKRQEEKANKKIAENQAELTDANQKLQEANAEANRNPEFFDKNLDVSSFAERFEELSQEISEVNEEINKINAQKQNLVNEHNQLAQNMDDVQGKFMEKASEAMFELDKQGRAADMELDVLPELNYEDSWPEASAAQQSFDEKASKESGKMVRNGQKGAGLFGSNIRDIITFIDKKKEQVEEIDVTEIFKGKIHTSKLEEMNSDVKHTNFMEDRSVVGVFGTRRDHIPSTTMFDSIKKENTSNKLQDYKQLVAQNTNFYRDLKRVFARRFKFSKKDFWRGGQEEGQFDNRNLWKLPTNQGDDFYERNNPKFENKVAASILVDMSGSQNKEATDYGNKIRALVVGLSQALDEVHIKHEVLGYHAPVSDEMRSMDSSAIYTRRTNRLETVVFKEAGQKDQMGIMNFEPQMSDNSDGESLRIALKRLKAIRAKSHMVFIISDGKPFLCDTDVSVLDEDFRGALRQAVRDKVQVFGVGYFNQLKEFLGERFCNATKNEDVLKFFEQAKF